MQVSALLRVTALLLGAAAAAPLWAQAFQPTRPIEVVVHGGPGSGVDLFARAIASVAEKEKLMQDFITAAKKSPGQLKQSGGSFTSVDNLTRLLIQQASDASWTFISFPGGGERLSNLLGDHVQIMFMQPQEAGEHIRMGTLRVITTLAENRLPSFPNVPTLREQGINVTVPVQARGVVAPPGIAPEVKDYWSGLFARLAKTPAWKKYLEENQLDDSFLGSADTSKYFDESAVQMRALLKEAGAKVVR